LRIRGEDFPRYFDSDLSISLTSYERQYFYIRMGGDGIGLTNLFIMMLVTVVVLHRSD
jgi:hypothetical protein